MLSNFARHHCDLCFSAFLRHFTQKTEKEKMLAGELYRARDPELVEERLHARDLVLEYNLSGPREIEKRKKLLKEIFQCDNDFKMEPPINVDYGKNTKIGNGTFFNFNTIILDVCPIEIGEKCLFASNVSLLSATHLTDPGSRWNGVELGKPIKIGNNVWVGGSVTICPGVTIGDNSVIGAGSVVAHDIPANSIAVGNPAKVVKKVPPPLPEYPLP